MRSRIWGHANVGCPGFGRIRPGSVRPGSVRIRWVSRIRRKCWVSRIRGGCPGFARIRGCPGFVGCPGFATPPSPGNVSRSCRSCRSRLEGSGRHRHNGSRCAPFARRWAHRCDRESGVTQMLGVPDSVVPDSVGRRPTLRAVTVALPVARRRVGVATFPAIRHSVTAGRCSGR